MRVGMEKTIHQNLMEVGFGHLFPENAAPSNSVMTTGLRSVIFWPWIKSIVSTGEVV